MSSKISTFHNDSQSYYQLMEACLKAGNYNPLTVNDLTKDEIVSSLKEALTTGSGVPNVDKSLVKMKIRKFTRLPNPQQPFKNPFTSLSASQASTLHQPVDSSITPINKLIKAIHTNDLKLAQEAIAEDEKIIEYATKDGYLMLTLDPDCYLLTGPIRDYFLSRSSHRLRKYESHISKYGSHIFASS